MRIVPKAAPRDSTRDGGDGTRVHETVVCMTARCDHTKARCSRCRMPECTHALDAGVCAPCQVRSGRGGVLEGQGPGDVARVYGDGEIEMVWTIGEGPAAPRRQWRGR